MRKADVALALLLAQQPWIMPIPGTATLHRLEERLVALGLEPAADDLVRIDTAASEIGIGAYACPKLR